MTTSISARSAALTDAWLPWWTWNRARIRLDQWIRTLIAERPYTVRFEVGQGSFVNFGTREIVVEPNFSASLAIHARYVPTTWGGADVLRPGTLDVLCARALAYHEAGHVLWTDVVALCGSTHGWLVNSLEDGRIERLTAARYAPAGRDFAELGKRIWLDGWKPVSDRTTTLLNACLFARWDAERPVETASRLVLADNEDRVLWETRIFPLVQQAWQASDTAHVATIALHILRLIGLPETDAAAHHGMNGNDLQRGSDGAVRGERQPGDESLGHDCIVMADGPSALRDTDPDADNALLASRAADVDPSSGRLWMQPYAALEASVAGAIRRLARELHVSAPESEATPNNRRGRFDARACVRSRGTTPVVRLDDEADDPRGLAIALLIDGTSSMGGSPGGVDPDGGPVSRASFESGRMPTVRQATMLLERTCAMLDVPLAIGFARDHAYPVHADTFGRVTLADPVVWLKRWDTPTNAEGPRALIAGLYGDATAEAVSRSLHVAQRELARRPEAVKVILYLHDGMPEDEEPEEVRATVERLRRVYGITIIGLYLGSQHNLDAMTVIFGKQSTIGLDDLAHLPARLGRILARFRNAR